MTGWNGTLLLGHGWAHYHGLAGDTAFHSHYPVQLVYTGGGQASVTLDDGVMKGRFLIIPSNVRHMLAPSREPLDMVYVEPSLLKGLDYEELPQKALLDMLQHLRPETDDPRMRRALAAIDRLLGGKVSQSDVARAAGMSKSSFTEMFRAFAGMPLRRFVLWRRLNVALEAVGVGANATMAAHSAGFSDSAHFSRTMKETFGVAPVDSVLKIQMLAVGSTALEV